MKFIKQAVLKLSNFSKICEVLEQICIYLQRADPVLYPEKTKYTIYIF